MSALRLSGGTIEDLRRNAHLADRAQSKLEQSVKNGLARRCTKCGEIKRLKSFHGKNHGRFVRLTKWCGECRVANTNRQARTAGTRAYSEGPQGSQG